MGKQNNKNLILEFGQDFKHVFFVRLFCVTPQWTLDLYHNMSFVLLPDSSKTWSTALAQKLDLNHSVLLISLLNPKLTPTYFPEGEAKTTTNLHVFSRPFGFFQGRLYKHRHNLVSE